MTKITQDSQEVTLAYGFNDVIERVFPDGKVQPSVVAGGVATLLVGYLGQLEPRQRMSVLSEMVEVTLSGLNDNVDTDIVLYN